ncbi:PDZ domain-containing protein [Amphritea sp. HPY]|uniref:PDZ domain-containing protein n=1 Tax=Amphritea sp. HPY TaxID=3421652 RepID=UPI003D7C4A24
MTYYSRFSTCCLLVVAFLTLTSCSTAQVKSAISTKPDTGGYLGIMVTAQTVKSKVPAAALVRITTVVPGSAADKAGLQIGDLLLGLDGNSLEKPPAEVLSHFRQLVQARSAGTRLSLLIRRRTISVQTFLDDTSYGEPKDLSVENQQRLPDLDQLMEEHPDQLVEVRTRALDREQEVEVVLTARSRALDHPLPDNASLRPDLEAEPLLPSAALAARVIALAHISQSPLQERFDQLLERFEQDERIDDPFRLRTIRYLHRAPLKLTNSTRGLGRDLRSVQADSLQGPNLEVLLGIVRRHLDMPEAVSKVSANLTARPGSGASAADHGSYLLALVRLAEQHVAQAFSYLSVTERKRLADSLPTLADQFAEIIYLHNDVDRQRWGQHAEVIRILPKVDRSELLAGLEVLLLAVMPDYLAQIERDLKTAEAGGERASEAAGTSGTILWRSAEDIVIGGSGENEYRFDFKVVVDIGGDDRYRTSVGAGRPDRPVALVIDLAGDDRYQSDKPFSQGTGFMGVGVLYDQAGDDRYTSNQSFAQGSALAGAGLLIDRAGDDVYRGIRYAQASALCHGLGAVLDGDGNDIFSAGGFAQGFAGPGAFGGLISRGGDDYYEALGLYRSSYPNGVGIYRGMSQGAGIGFRHLSSGGIGVLLDDGGKDFYEAGNFSQGGGYYFGWGLLIDLGVDPDRYEGSRYAQGFASHSALGSFLDEGGNDIYKSWVGAGNSAAWDLSATVFLDDGGNDHYAAGSGFSLGASAHNGFALFVDHDGEDLYQITPGRAGPNSYHGGSSLSIFVDAGGQSDRYEGGGLSDEQGRIKGETGVLLDLPETIKNADDVILKRLLLTEGIQTFDFIESEKNRR